MCKVLEQNTNDVFKNSRHETSNFFPLCVARFKINPQIRFCSFEADDWKTLLNAYCCKHFIYITYMQKRYVHINLYICIFYCKLPPAFSPFQSVYNTELQNIQNWMFLISSLAFDLIYIFSQVFAVLTALNLQKASIPLKSIPSCNIFAYMWGNTSPVGLLQI